VSRYNSVHIFITFSLILHCIACCSQIHPIIIIIIIHIFNHLGSDPLCYCQSVQYTFYWPSSITLPMQNLIQNSCVVIFIYHFQNLPFGGGSWNCVCKFCSSATVTSSFLFWFQYCNFFCCLGRCFASLCYFLVVFALVIHMKEKIVLLSYRIL